MPTGPKGQKRPADVIGNAVRVNSLDAQGHHHRGKRGGPLPGWKRSRTSGENLFRVLFITEAPRSLRETRDASPRNSVRKVLA
jgi:hypothetical protein